MNSPLAKDNVTLPCDIKHETDRAILIRCHDVDGEVVQQWIPLSQVSEIHRKESISAGLFTDSIVCSRWIAHNRGLV